MAMPMDLSSLPNLPGYNFYKRKDRYAKNKQFEVVSGVRIEHQEGITYEKPRMVKAGKASETWRTGSLPDSTMRDEFPAPPEAAAREHAELPAWDALDRHVLRFFGYFKESVVETNLENWRTRRCVLFYYLEDDTCLVTEKKQDNSGIPQGTLIRRHRFPGPTGGFLTPQDLEVGGHLNIYGRAIKIVDCDLYTREYYLRNGIEQGPAEEVEGDAFDASQPKKGTGGVGIPRTHERLYREVQLGGGHINTNMQQFLEWDRKVCRFFAVQDDLSMPTFERRPFVILYFLADDTLEIREQYPLNCGRDNFPIFFRKGKILKGAAQVLGPMDQHAKAQEYVGLEELRVGEMVNLQGFNFFIYDVDEFTRGYFDEALKIQLEPRRDVQLPERAVPRPETPPYTGFGSWDDSMTSVLSLIPKPPIKDFKKLYLNDGKILRFTARFLDPKPEDAERLFVVNFHLFDDTLSIHEPPQRNLGIVTGKFLEKNVHLNMVTGALFKPEDLYKGATIEVHGRVFELLDCDDYTRRYYANEEGTSRLDLGVVLEKLREGMRQQFPLVRDVFRKFDSDKDGVLTVSEFKQALEKYGFQLTTPEVLVIMKHFDTRQDGQVSYNEFCDVLLDEDYTTQMMKMKAPIKKDADARYQVRAEMKTEERAETEQVRKAVRAISEVVYKQGQVMAKLMKEFAHMTHQNAVTSHQIKQGLSNIGKTFSLDEVQRTVLFVNPDADLEAINYVEFLKSMVAIYHDMCKVR
jgi:Ca2+-binding EF-hand superfamily protein